MGLLLMLAVRRLGSDKEIMNSYWAYHEQEQNWFFSLDDTQEKFDITIQYITSNGRLC